jgi:hypothetical protein
MSNHLNKLAAEFNRYFTSSNGVDVPEHVSVSRDEWRQLHAALHTYGHATQPAEVTDEREAFEAEMRCEDVWGHRSLKKRPDGRYQNWQVDLMWDVWQARSILTMRPMQVTETELKVARDEFNNAIDFAIKEGIGAAVFLDAWRHGDTTEWPEFHGITAQAKKE